MRAALLNTYDERGGAARAALRLHRALPSAGVDSRLVVQRRFGHGPGVIGPRGGIEGGLPGILATLRPRLESIPVRRYPHRRQSLFSPAFLPDGIAGRIRRIEPDVVHLHWVGFGFVQPETLARFGRPIVWTLHDSWPFTGGCHLPGDCVRYREVCGACPALGSADEDDLSRRLIRRKQRAWFELVAAGGIHFVAPSRWIADAARSSTLAGGLPLEIIPNGVDMARFQPRDREAARERLRLPRESRTVLFSGLEGLGDRNKGFDLLLAALGRMETSTPDFRLLVIGAKAPDVAFPDALRDRTHFAGQVDDEDLVAWHLAAADLLVLPSRQENQPNLVVEAMACGRPVVAFRTSGLPELVEHGQTGLLADPFDPEGLAVGMSQILRDPPRARAMGDRARAQAERRFDAALCAQSHRAVYEEAVSRYRGLSS